MEAACYGDDMLDPDEIAPGRFRPLRRVEYEQLVEAGAFEDEPIELLRGQIVTMTPQGPEHVNSSARIANMLVRQLGEDVLVLSHSGLAAWDDSMPEPDVAVVPAGPMNAHATSAFLVVEVSNTSLRRDLRVKARLYAEASIPAYWVVDLARRVVHVFTRPVDGRYASVVERVPGDVLGVDELPAVAIPVSEIVPPA